MSKKKLVIQKESPVPGERSYLSGRTFSDSNKKYLVTNYETNQPSLGYPVYNDFFGGDAENKQRKQWNELSTFISERQMLGLLHTVAERTSQPSFQNSVLGNRDLVRNEGIGGFLEGFSEGPTQRERREMKEQDQDF